MVLQSVTRIFPIFLSLVLLTALSSAEGQQITTESRFPPFDEAVRDPALVTGRSKLMRAAKAHDIRTIEKLSVPNVSGCGWSGFQQMAQVLDWKYPNAYPDNAWDEFYNSLSLGGTFGSEGEFASNYVVSQVFYDDPDLESYLVVLGEHIALRKAPETSAPVLVYLSYAAVKEAGLAVHGWDNVTFGDQTGYVRQEKLASPIGMSVILKKQNGKWRMTNISTFCE